MTKLKYLPIFGPTKRPYRLVAQDSGFSFPQQRFETAWGYKKGSALLDLFLYPQANRLTGYKRNQSFDWFLFSTASKGSHKKEPAEKRVLFLYPRKKTPYLPLTNKKSFLYLVAQIAPIV